MVERNGEPSASVASPEQRRQRQEQLERAWEVVEQVRERNADMTPEQVLDEVTAEFEAVRQERYARRAGADQGRR